MKVFIASDHAAFLAKNHLLQYLKTKYDIIDLGTHSADSVNYPEYAKNLCHQLLQEKSDAKGILLCGSGIGVSMTANRFKGIRAALCRDTEDAVLSRQHNNANVLCLGARKTSLSELEAICDIWLNTPFEGGRHQTRIDLFNGLGELC